MKTSYTTHVSPTDEKELPTLPDRLHNTMPRSKFSKLYTAALVHHSLMLHHVDAILTSTLNLLRTQVILHDY